MDKFYKNKLIFSVLVLMISFSQSWAQSSLKELSVNYNELRLDKGYTILYDNPNETAKLNEFKIKFYRDETYIDETAVENFPSNGTIVTYRLTNSIIGFNNAKPVSYTHLTLPTICSV